MPGPPVQLGITLDAPAAERVDQRLARIPPNVRRVLVEVVRTGLEDARDWMIRERLTGGLLGGGTTSTRLSRRSGNLIASLVVRVRETARKVTGLLTIDRRYRARVYAGVHEHGATIRPRTAKALTVPLIPAAQGRRARDVPGLFAITSQRGNRLLVRRVGLALERWYVLRDRVVIPARPFFAPTRQLWIPRIRARIRAALRDMMRGR